MTRPLALALLLLLATPAHATVDMLLPVAVERHAGGWTLLHYAAEPFAPGEVRLVMLCLRAVGMPATVPHLTVLAESETPRKDKVRVLVSEAGFLPVGSAAMPPYVTYRVQHFGDEETAYGFRVWVRGE